MRAEVYTNGRRVAGGGDAMGWSTNPKTTRRRFVAEADEPDHKVTTIMGLHAEVHARLEDDLPWSLC
jgi:hypothetical protein